MKAMSVFLAMVTIFTFRAAQAQSLTEDQAVQMLRTEIQADDAKLSAGQPVIPKSQLDSANGTVCNQTTVQNRSVKWCLQPTDRSKNPFVIYFFHGLTLDEHRWQEAQFSNDLQAIWKAKGFAPPTVITISFGPVWLLTQTRDKKYDFFLNALMPYFEKMIGPVSADQRIAMGESMGGFNAAELLLKNPQLFSRFVLQCPAVTQVGPFDPDKDLVAFIERTGADWKRAVLTKVIGAYEMQNNSNWIQHSPLGLSESTPGLPTKVYLSCGDHDAFGFYEGVGIMAQILANKTEGLQYVFIPGGQHGTVDAPSMADFVSADWTQSP